MTNRLKNAARAAMVVAVLALAGAPALAHEVTYKGTVIAVESTTLRVSVIDDATKKASPMAFAITERTRVYRGDKVVSITQARIQKGERIAVTINHDEPGQKATEIRLAAGK